MLETKKLKYYWIFTMILTGITLFAMSYNLIVSLLHIKSIDFYTVLMQVLLVIAISMILFVLVYVYVRKTPFHTIVYHTLRVFSLVLLVYACIPPNFAGHTQISPFKILNSGDHYLLDGWFLLYSLLVFLFSKMVRYGTGLQNEVDDLI